jgi:cysteine-rich repeat protein
MTTEKCIQQPLVGCGDGILNSWNVESCDDGNQLSGDGCSSLCQVESHYNCTNAQGQLSVCTYMTCGDSLQQAGEQCDDGNQLDGDGCSSTCLSELGYNCANFYSCYLGCGDSSILQQNRTHANGTSYVYY